MPKKPPQPSVEPPAETEPQKQQQQDAGRGQTAADINPADATSDERGPSGADIKQQQ